ncbi:retrovirus-related pol polyprotein from transposon TNT 1-94 [Tanacetum coccineum]
MDSENDNEKINLPSPEPTVSCLDDLDFFKDFENEFPAIVYNDALTSKSNFLTEPTVSPQHIDEFNLKDETSLSEWDEASRTLRRSPPSNHDPSSFNPSLAPLDHVHVSQPIKTLRIASVAMCLSGVSGAYPSRSILFPDDSKSDEDNNDDKIDIEHSSGDLSVKPLPDVINTDDGAYAHGSNKLLETSHDKSKPKNINEALKDENWVMAMQEELNQFKTNDVWELVPNPMDMTIIGTKWVYRNKLDENDVITRNKVRLVAQGYNQQEGIDYDETYAPVARLESIRILLAYACALDFKLYQMDVKSAFLNGFINEEVYVAQPLGFIDFTKPNYVYKLKKALYGQKQAPKACRPDIMFSVCLCARFQEDPKTSHLEAVKRIFRYIKGTTHLGLWYPKGSDIEIIMYADSDHAGDYVDCKSTSGVCTFMGSLYKHRGFQEANALGHLPLPKRSM